MLIHSAIILTLLITNTLFINELINRFGTTQGL